VPEDTQFRPDFPGKTRGEDDLFVVFRARNSHFSPMPAPRLPNPVSPAKRPPVALTIAGSDPSGGAGQEADLKAFLRHGVYGMNLTTLLTVQNTRGVQDVKPLDPDYLSLQWKALFADIRPDVIKLGALGSLPMVKRVAKLLNSPQARDIPVVLDPVLGSTSGSPLLAAEALKVFKSALLPRCRVVTPNLPEFEVLFGPFPSGRDPVKNLKSLGPLPYAILLKGGHAQATTVTGSPDWLLEGGRVFGLPGVRYAVGNIHGTGCTLAASVAANLALGRSLPAACRAAKAFVARGIATAPALGRGSGPLNFMA
jgi:hydroxymethylpyrimidine/phosphomethylpyrimidine kinase